MLMYFHLKLKIQYFQRVISGKMDTISRTDGDGEHGTWRYANYGKIKK